MRRRKKKRRTRDLLRRVGTVHPLDAPMDFDRWTLTHLRERRGAAAELAAGGRRLALEGPARMRVSRPRVSVRRAGRLGRRGGRVGGTLDAGKGRGRFPTNRRINELALRRAKGRCMGQGRRGGEDGARRQSPGLSCCDRADKSVVCRAHRLPLHDGVFVAGDLDSVAVAVTFNLLRRNFATECISASSQRIEWRRGKKRLTGQCRYQPRTRAPQRRN